MTPIRSAWRKRIALSLGSLLFTLLLAEGALRLLGVARAGRGSEWFAGGNHPRFLFQADPAAAYTLRPGFKGVEMNPQGDFREPVEVDSRGMRRQPHPAPPAPAVLALGDSMTFGEGVPADQTYSALAERISGVRVENAGVPGYSSRQMAERLKGLLPLFHPRLVTLAFSPLWDRQRCAHPFVYKEGFIVGEGYAKRLHLWDGNLYLAETELPVAGTATAYAKRRSRVMRLLLPPLGDGLRALRRGSRQEPPPGPEDYEPTIAAVERARGLSRGAGAELLVLLLDDRGADFARDRREVERRLRERGIPFLAVDEEVPQADWKRLRFQHDGHWNRAGHQAAGFLLANRIRTSQERVP